jgi:signal transduction histidine kinase
MIFKEAINNAIKHSECSKMSLEASVQNDKIVILVADDGVGFEPDEIQSGNGMKNMLNRTKKIGGEIKWSSSAGKGTTVIFTGKLSKIIKLKSLFNI